MDRLLTSIFNTECLLCDIVRRSHDVPFLMLMGGEYAEMQELDLCESSRVILDVSPVGVGHILIMPNGHVSSMANTSKVVMRSVVEKRNRVNEFVLLHKKMTMLWFEHGECESRGAQGCSIKHAHLHGVPFQSPLLVEVQSYINSSWPGQMFSKSDGIESLRDYYNGYSYLYYESALTGGWVVKTNDAPAQFFRKVITHYLGSSELWSWHDKIVADAERTKETLLKSISFYNGYNSYRENIAK